MSITPIAGRRLVGLAISLGLMGICPAVADEPPVCAVIPFENLSGRPESAYLADIIHQGLYAAFEPTRVWRMVERDRLKAILRESDLKASGADGRQARIAGADVLVVGEYRDDGGVVTVSARLDDAVTGEIIRQASWSGHVSGLADTMPPRVAAALAGQTPPGEELPPPMVTLFNRACRHLERGRVDEAIAGCDRILEVHRRDVPTLLLRGYTGLEKQGWTRYAQKDFEKVLTIDDASIAARLGLARTKLTGDRRVAEEAVPWLQEVLDERPDLGEALWLLAQVHELCGRHAEAAGAANRAVECMPEFGPAWQTLARLLRASGDLDQALKASGQATACDPTDPWAWTLLGDVQSDKGDTTSAQVSWRKALTCEPPPDLKDKLNARLRKYN